MPKWIYQHLYFEGIISIRVADRSFKMIHYGYELENEIFWKGLEEGWEKTSMKIWTELSQRSKYIVDAGANTGVFSLVSKSVNSDARVFAFEPVQRVFDKLDRNIKLNRFDITPIRKGLSNFEGTAMIYDLPTDHVYSVTININTNPPDCMVIPTEVEVTTLDAYCKQTGLEEIDLLKIDVETHEPAVLEGALNIFRKSQPAMIIEILNKEVADRVNEILKEFDYVFFSLNEKSGPVSRSKVGDHDFGNYLICKRSVAASLKLVV